MEADERIASSKLTTLRARIAEAKRSGVRVRTEWLGGETGGGCEIAGTRWIFLDLSLSVDEQLGQLADALAMFGIPAKAPADATQLREPTPLAPAASRAPAARSLPSGSRVRR